MKKIFGIYQDFRPFTDQEAWMLFKIAAFGEAVGWTILITGIGLTEYVFHGNRIPVVLAGRTHGVLFMLYITAVLVLAPSLRWKWKRVIIAGLMSVPPFGTIAVEMWISHHRSTKSLIQYSRTIRYQQITAKS